MRLRADLSAQKTFQVSETETRELVEGTRESNVFPMRDHLFDPKAISCFRKKANRKIELLATP